MSSAQPSSIKSLCVRRTSIRLNSPLRTRSSKTGYRTTDFEGLSLDQPSTITLNRMRAFLSTTMKPAV